MATVSNATTQIAFAYDPMGRRVGKTVTGGLACAFVYDGWNPVREVTTQGGLAATNFYVWGLDLSGTLQGAGGVGGLVATIRDGAPRLLAYDANGNVSDYLSSNGTSVAHYEYDPFGNTLVATGPMSSAFPHRFSTKYWDPETALYYYGYRYYSPGTGRWPSRDPIGELGGENLYGYAGNDPVDRMAPWGLCDVYAVSDMNNDGLCARWRKVTTAEDVRIYENLSSGSVWGLFNEPQSALASDECDVMLPVSILIRRVLADGVLRNHRYKYTTHAPPGNAGRFEVIPDGLAPKEQIVMHERGHAEAFLEFVIPCMQRSLGANKCYSEGRSTEIDNALKACLRDAQYKQASDRYADRGTILYFSGRCRVVDRGNGQITWSCE